jgi:hypothetical protein
LTERRRAAASAGAPRLQPVSRDVTFFEASAIDVK